MIEIWFDGACEPKNPGGHIGFGAVIRDDKDNLDHVIAGYMGMSEENSNNVAEYQALIAALKWLRAENLHREEIICYGDSQLVINQMFGSWGVKQGLYVPYAHSCARILQPDFPRISGKWIPREQNIEADDLSKLELKKRGISPRSRR